MTKNKVYVLVAVLAVCLAIFIFRPENTLAPTENEKPVIVPAVLLPASGEITLAAGQAGQIGDLSIVWKEPLHDSRCPKSVQCVWAGEVTVAVTLKDALNSDTISITAGKEPKLFDGHTISISSVLPYPATPGEIPSKDYRVTFHVSVGDTKRK